MKRLFVLSVLLLLTNCENSITGPDGGKLVSQWHQASAHHPTATTWYREDLQFFDNGTVTWTEYEGPSRSSTGSYSISGSSITLDFTDPLAEHREGTFTDERMTLRSSGWTLVYDRVR